MNNLLVVIVFKDNVGCYEFVNVCFEEVFGLYVDEVVGKIDL